MTTIESLLERVRAATYGEYNLDMDLLKELFPGLPMLSAEYRWCPTRDLDGIIAVIERKLPGWSRTIRNNDPAYDGAPSVELLPPQFAGQNLGWTHTGKTEALACCVALLEQLKARALIAQAKEEESGK